MRIETQTKQLAQVVFLFSAASLCAIVLCMAVTPRHNVLARRTGPFPVYTYQNPFNLANKPDSAISKKKAGGVLAKFTSVKFLLGLSGLGALWVASTWYLQGGWSGKKRVQKEINDAATNPKIKMAPLALLPKRVTHVEKQDIFEIPVRSTILSQKPTRCLPAHRKKIAPCQSRFRPVTLIPSQTRFGRL